MKIIVYGFYLVKIILFFITNNICIFITNNIFMTTHIIFHHFMKNKEIYVVIEKIIKYNKSSSIVLYPISDNVWILL